MKTCFLRLLKMKLKKNLIFKCVNDSKFINIELLFVMSVMIIRIRFSAFVLNMSSMKRV
jgi:hypothetical protein